MESELLPDIQKDIPPVPIKTYQWEDLKRAREAGAYPWTHLLKVPLQGVITAEDIIRETTPKRSMSREFSRSRTHSPVDNDIQRILNLDSSPGSSRRHGEEGEDTGVQIPNFSKEISLDSEDDTVTQTVKSYVAKPPENESVHLATPIEIPKSVSPKGILKRRVPEQQYNIGLTSETREKTKCCHPLVNKIKHLADKTLHKLERSETEKSPVPKRKKKYEDQEIRQLRSSPSAVRRQKFSAIKLGDSDEMSKTMSLDTPPPRKKKEHIYEDIEETKESEKSLHFSNTNNSSTHDIESISNSNKENESVIEQKSIASQDPSLVMDEASLKNEEHVMEKLHKVDNVNKEAILLDEEMDPDEPNVDEIFQNQLDERGADSESPNITITEITEEEAAFNNQPSPSPITTSPTPSPHDADDRKYIEFPARKWSKPSSDHEYEIIEKPTPNIIYTAPSVDEKPQKMVKTDDELSSTTSLERKFLQHTSDEEEQLDENLQDDKSADMLNAETLQKDIEDRYFTNTPSTPSRTECEVSTSQVDSSALEQLPLKRDSRFKNTEVTDSKIQQRIREGTGKLKTQAGKLKTKLQNIKTKQFTMPEKPKFTLPERPKFKMPQRPKISFPDRSKFRLPDKRKFSLPDRPKFNLAEKLNRSKFTLPERPKFNVPEFNVPKFKMPERPKINFPSLGRKKEYKVTNDSIESNDAVANVATVEFEARTYPRIFSRKKSTELPRTSSSPTLNREDTPPPTFTFTRVKKNNEKPAYIPDSPEEPREYGNNDENYEIDDNSHLDTTYDFDKLDTGYMDEEPEVSNLQENHTTTSFNDISPSKPEYTHVITEINNDEFFVRPRGISREDIQTREYLSDETRKAFQTPKNILSLMGGHSGSNDEQMYINDPEDDPELMIDDNEPMRYSNEDLNDKDDGYYTFPPVRPSRAKRKKKEEECTPYIDESVNASMQFSEVDLDIQDDQNIDHANCEGQDHIDMHVSRHLDFTPSNDLHSIHEYANDDVIQYPENIPIQSQTLPMPPKRKKKFGKRDYKHSSLTDFNIVPVSELWEETQENNDNIIVYRTEHEYTVPQEYAQSTVTEQSPVPPRRNRSRSSRGTSVCDDDRTSHGAESLTLDTNLPPNDEVNLVREIRYESPGYATVDKGPTVPSKGTRRSKSKTPPRPRKSNSSERKYYTVGSTKPVVPDRPPRKKSSTSLLTLDSFTKRSMSGDLTQYIEIEEPFEEVHKKLNSGEVVSKMKDRPLPPPPRPPRGSRRGRKDKGEASPEEFPHNYEVDPKKNDDVIEIEVSTQTDPLPDDVDFELGIDENLDMSISSSLRDIIDDDSILTKSQTKLIGNNRNSRPTSRSERSLKLSEPIISELSKPNIGRTSPTVILVERRVSSPTRINEHDEMLTEASLTVQHIDIDHSQIPDVPPLPRPRGISSSGKSLKNNKLATEEQALEKVSETSRDVQLDNLITQRLQVKDLDVGRLNVSELQANKILVSDIEGMTLQVSELDSKSGHISVSGIEFSQSVIDEIVKKFTELSTNHIPQPPQPSVVNLEVIEPPRPVSREEHTQTDTVPEEIKMETKSTLDEEILSPPPRVSSADDTVTPPQRPPPPDLTPLLYSYLQDLTIPPMSFFQSRSLRERPFTEYHDTQHQTPPPPIRRAKRKPAAPHSESSSENGKPRPSPRRVAVPVRTHEPSITEAGAQFLRVCHSSITRTIRKILNSFMSYISGAEDKKDIQMAMVIFLVLIAGLLMFGLSDSRAIHHHHWEFFNPPDGKP